MELLEETIRRLKEEANKLEEIADTKRQIIRDLNDHSDQIIFHLVYCYFWKDITNNFNHGCQEI